MPSTYTLNNGIELISTGEQSGTWGDTTNTNLSLLDTALDGQVTVTLPSAGTSGSPNTLAITDGAASDGRNRMVTFADGGDLGATAFVQLTPNDSEKIIYVRNNLAGSRSIILFQGTYNASNDYELPAGTTAVIYFDGAGSGAVAANVFNNAHFDALNVVGNVTVGGDVTVTGTVDAGTVEFDNLSGTGAVSVTNILDEDNMASDSATALSTQQSIKAYVDAQVGTVDTLAEILANGNTTGGTDIVVSVDDVISMDNGTNLLPSLTTTGDLNTGLYFPAADEVGLTVGGTQRLNVSATGIDVTGTVTADGLNVLAGNGVIGTAQINKDSDGLGGVSSVALSLANDGTSAGTGVSLRFSPADVQTAARGSLVSSTLEGANGSNLELWTVVNGQSPHKSMEIDGNGDITFYEADGTTASFVYDADAGTTFNEAGSDRDFRVESDGNSAMLFVDAGNNRVGIGTSSPTATFQIDGTTVLQNAATTQLTLNATNDGSGSHVGMIEVNTNVARGSHIALTDNNGVQFGIKRDYSGGSPITRASIYTDNGTTEKPVMTFDYDGVTVFNEDGYDQDFRVESDTFTHALFVNGANGQIGLGDSSPASKLVVDGGRASEGVTAGGTYTELTRTTGGDLGLLFNKDTAKWLVGIDNSDGNAAPLRFEYGAYGATHPGLGGGVLGLSLSYLGGITNTPVAGGHVVFNEGGVDADFRVESDTNDHMLFVDAGNNRVGVGAAAPYKTLEVEGDIQLDATDASIWLKSGTTGTSGYVNWTFNTDDTVFAYAGIDYDTRATIGFAIDSGYPITLDASMTTSYGVDIRNGGTALHRIKSDLTVFNILGADHDFRVESDNNANMLFVDAGGDRVYVGTTTGTAGNLVVASNSGANGIQINARVSNDYGFLNFYNNTADAVWGSVAGYSGTGLLFYQGTTEIFRINSSGAIFNEAGNDRDFRVESDSVANMFFVDASTNRIGINTNAPTTDVDIVGQGANFADIKLRDAAGRVLEIKSPSDSSEATIATTTNHNLEIHAGAGGATNYITFKTDTVERLEISSNSVIFNDTGADTDFRVESDTTTHMLFVDASANAVGIGTSNPATSFHVTDGGTPPTISATYLIAATSASNAGIAINAGNTSASIIALGDTDSQDIGVIRYDHSDNSMSLKTSATEVMRLDSSGHAIIPAGVTLGTAAGVYAAANTLDDYEEGTFTPTAFGATAAGTTTYASQTGSYTKVGDTVHVDIYISWSAMTGTGDLRIGGLPFTSSSASNYYATGTIVPLLGFTWPSGKTQLNPLIAASETSMAIYGSATDSNSARAATDNEIVALAITITYKV
jgi:hypothetical protein